MSMSSSNPNPPAGGSPPPPRSARRMTTPRPARWMTERCSIPTRTTTSIDSADADRLAADPDDADDDLFDRD